MFDRRKLSRCHLVFLLLTVEVTSRVQDGERASRSDDLGALQVVVQTQAQEIATLRAQLQATDTSLRAAEAKISTLGSTYVRWGRSVCPAVAELVYKGIAAGSKRDEQGGGVNRLCMSSDPTFDHASFSGDWHTNIHGTEFYIPGHHGTDAPCAVCRTAHPTTIMIPGTNSCPPGWTAQYSGHIMAGDSRYQTSSEYLCVDGQPEDMQGTGVQLADGNFFMYSSTACGSLPCPPYVDGRVVTCVVCSK